MNIKLSLIIFSLLMSACISACRNGKSEEANRINDIVLANVAIGDRKDVVLEFFKRQHWEVTYDKWNNCYGTGIPVKQENGLTVHSIIVKVSFSDDDKANRIVVNDAWKP